MTLVAAHQPNFFPWLGFFNKIWRCDRFVVLDDVQFQKKGGTWINRVRLANGTADHWTTAPVQRTYSGTRTIAEMLLDDRQDWRGKLCKTLEGHYRKAPFFEQCYPWVRPLLELPTSSLLELNLNAISTLMTQLGLDTGKLVLSSTLRSRGTATERVVSLTQSAGGEAYLSGSYAMATYQDPLLFERAGISLIPQDFHHPQYPRGGGFVAGLSILDPLFWCGPEQTSRLVTGTRP